MNNNDTYSVKGFTELIPQQHETLTSLLNLDTWVASNDFMGLYHQNARTNQLIQDGMVQEETYNRIIRRAIFPRLQEDLDIANAGVYRVRQKDIEQVLAGLLFNGNVEACDGTRATHDALPVTINQIGVSLVSYNGELGAWMHRIFRRDYTEKGIDPAEAAFDLLNRRQKREAQGIEGVDPMSRLAGRGIMAFAERALLKEKSSAQWRMGHGSPIPYELVTGFWASSRANLRKSLDLISWYVNDHKRFLFIPSAPRKRELLTLANALPAGHFMIISSLRRDVEDFIEQGGYTAVGTRSIMHEFANEIASQVVIGAYRIWEGAPPYLFYAHKDFANIAAHIAMADSSLQFHRGFPMLLDLADVICTANFSTSEFTAAIQDAYTQAGQPFRYLGERETRRL